jgi:competence protein ComEA
MEKFMEKNLLTGITVLLFVSGLALAEGNPPAVININTADQATLAALPGVGKHRAKAIVDYRQSHGAFKSVHDLTQVKGLNEKNLQKILKHNPDQLVAD